MTLGPESTSARLLLAEALSRAQKYDEAEAEVAQVLIREPENVEARIIRADLERNQDDSTGALQTLEEARRPGSTPAITLCSCAWEIFTENREIVRGP